ncbi:MAG: hypothetical protein ACR2N4_02575 [Jatrophihabitans sp.]
MRAPYDHTLVLADLPADPRWHFGGFPGGLEPLTLPFPDEPDRRAGRAPERFAETCREIARLSRARLPDWQQSATEDDSLFWFRWITGHQVSFVVWRLAGQLLAGGGDPATALPRLQLYVDVYSAMLLYSGSCPRSVYHRTIRPSMQLRHPGFSGAWAPDYAPVRHLLRGRSFGLAGSSSASELDRRVEFNLHVHEYVAAKLVPDGVSLLRGSEPGSRRQDGRLLNMIFDNYFLTMRAPVSRAEVIAQLLRRIVAILDDLGSNGYRVEAVGEGVPAVLAAQLRRCEQTIPQILDELARTAVSAELGTPRRRELPVAVPL